MVDRLFVVSFADRQFYDDWVRVPLRVLIGPHTDQLPTSVEHLTYMSDLVLSDL